MTLFVLFLWAELIPADNDDTKDKFHFGKCFEGKGRVISEPFILVTHCTVALSGVIFISTHI